MAGSLHFSEGSIVYRMWGPLMWWASKGKKMEAKVQRESNERMKLRKMLSLSLLSLILSGWLWCA